MPHVAAMAARLSPPPPEHVYCLWVGSQGQMHLAGVLTLNEQGFGLLVFDADRNGPEYDVVQLTLQPTGSTSPTSPPVLLWKVAP